MKTYLTASLALIMGATMAHVGHAQSADLKLAALPASDFAFCLASDAVFVAGATSATETGIVVTNVGNALTNTGGKVVVAANNFYKNGAGGEWTSNMGQFNLPGGSCYNVATMMKTTSPNGSTAWTCAATSGAASNAGATISGLISTQTQVLNIATGYVTAGVSSTLNNAPTVNCPY
ncbi:hypothetical protein MUU53_14990 [Rhizobium lemnae]|uniref:Uncharacterized protein n=1 Tax=Rhizobium lemnae TaxID=1214924 RepID=A0ABV8EB28_9HYPH|nr:hypothetical protein [Rhizobium lemnae]MCJ8509222.1 hypothetical protein [Rhizobium lemnae]